MHADGRGGGEAGGAHASDLGHHHPLLDRVRPDDHLLRLPGADHGPPPPQLRHPRRLPHRLLRRLHPPHRPHLRPLPRAPRPPLHRQPPRPLPAPAHLRRPPPLPPRHARRRPHRAKAPLPRRHPLRLPPRAAVLPRRSRRGLHLHRAAGLLPARVPQGHEDHEHGPLPQHALAGLLPQHRPRQRRAHSHHLRPSAAVARRQPRRGQALQLLLAARRDQRRQPARVRGRGQGLRLQGEAPRGRRHPAGR
uniref:Uncharacterized protein n=1 Tax=Arundo donax TaxID=35708 RepID=A0A0A9DQ10_ARUDO